MNRGHEAYDGGVDALNPEIKKMAGEEGASVVDLHSAFSGNEETHLGADGLHPNNAGQQLIADRFARSL
jgi:lysophospholipase L1-like esterase